MVRETVLKTKRLTPNQLAIVTILQSRKGLKVVGREILTSDGVLVDTIDGRGVRGLVSNGVLIPVKGIDNIPTGEYRLCNAAMNTRFLPSGRATSGGEGAEQRPTWKKIKEIGEEHGVLIHWRVSYGSGVLYIMHKNRASALRSRRTIVLTDNDGNEISGAMHFATMREWREFLEPWIEKSKKLFLHEKKTH